MQKPNINEFASHFDSRLQYSVGETGPTASIFMPSTSFEKGSLGPHNSLYETTGEPSLGHQFTDPLTVQESQFADTLAQDSIESHPPKNVQISVRDSSNPNNNSIP